VQYDVKFRIRRIPSRMVNQLLELAEANRAELLEQWTRSNPND
jgi:hypothetical protein